MRAAIANFAMHVLLVSGMILAHALLFHGQGTAPQEMAESRSAQPAIAFDQIDRVLLWGQNPPPVDSFAADAATIAALPPLKADLGGKKRALVQAAGNMLLSAAASYIPIAGPLIAGATSRAANALELAAEQREMEKHNAAVAHFISAGAISLYEIVDQSQVAGGHLAAQAYILRPATSRTVKMVVKSVESDASAIVHIDFNTPFPASAAALARASQLAALSAEWEAQNRYKQVDARLTREGALMVAVDNSQQEDLTMKGKSLPQVRDAAVAEVHSPAYQAKLAAKEAFGLFSVPNAIVLSCAKRASLADGDAWRVVSKSDSAVYDVTVKGKQSYRGHNVVVFNAKLRSDYSSGSTNVDATVYYDLKAGLVVGTCTVTISRVQATGMTSTSTADLNLKE